MDAQLLVSLKALSDAPRLRIVGLLAAGRRMTVEDLAASLQMTPGTVVHHLNRLREGGLIESWPRPPYMDYSLRLERLAQIGAELGRLSREQAAEGAELASAEAEWASGRHAQVLRSFFEGARLLSIPAQHSKRLVVLRYLAETVFAEEREYPEKEINQLLALHHPDVASLRRYLVDEGFMRREASVYRLRPRDEWPPLSG